MNISVIAEGVEINDQLEILKSQECDILQGYLFSRPLSDTQLTELIQQSAEKE